MGAMGGVEATDAGSVRTDFKYGRDRGRSLAAIQRGQAASAVFRQALLLGAAAAGDFLEPRTQLVRVAREVVEAR
jgi:hypothetical protein